MQEHAPLSDDRAAVARDLESFLNRRAERVGDLPQAEIDAAIDEALDSVRHSRPQP